MASIQGLAGLVSTGMSIRSKAKDDVGGDDDCRRMCRAVLSFWCLLFLHVIMFVCFFFVIVLPVVVC